MPILKSLQFSRPSKQDRPACQARSQKLTNCTASPQRLGEIAERLLQPYFDECKAALADGIVEDEDVLDAGLIFGTGFAPFRGGPLHYLEQKGARQ